jgi:RNA polymerase sigma factor (sigma-70 family)
MLNDAELLRRHVHEGSDAAFTQLVERHLGLVYSAALRRLGGDGHAAADVAQQVFVALARQAPRLLQGPPLPGWLYSTTRNLAVSHVRAEQRRRRWEHAAHAMHEVNTPDSGPAAWEQVRPLLDATMDELAGADQESIVLRFFSGRSYAEIGAALRTTEDAARMRVGRALEKLHAALEKRGVTSSAAALSAVLAQQAVAAPPAGLAGAVVGVALAAEKTAVAVAPLAFMSSKATAATLVVLALVSSSVGLYELRGLHSAQAQLAADRRDVFALGSRVADAQRRTQEALRTLASRQSASAPAPATPPPAVEAEERGPFGPNPPGSRARGRALMAAYPEIQRLVIDEKRAFFSAHYAKLYRELGLTPAQIEAFEQIMIAGVSSTYGDGPNTVTLDAAPAIPWAEKQARVRALLGERGFQLWDNYHSGQDGRAVMLASALYFTDTPLTAEQGQKFQEVLIAAGKAIGQEPEPSVYWATVREQAVAFLSPPQLEALRGLQANDEFNYARMQNQKLRERTPAAK